MEPLPNWSLTVLMVMQVVLISFWIVMVISVPMAPMRLFEDHKHKHLWLYTVLFVPVIGAIWYFIVTFINNDFTFFNVPASNRLVCDKPKKKHMRCTAYKNGVKTKSFPVG